MSDERVEELIQQLGHEDESVVQTASQALMKIGVPAVPALVEAFEGINRNVRMRAVVALGEIRDASAAPALIVAFLSLDARQSAVEALVKIGVPAVPALVGALEDKTNYRIVRENAAQALGRIGDASAAPALIVALGDDAWPYALEALVKIGVPAVPALVGALEDKTNPRSVRQYSTQALGDIGDSSAITALVGALGDEYYGVRWYAIRALGGIGDSSAITALVGALGDESAGIREWAAWALGKIGDASVVTELIVALGDGRVGVRRNAVEALGEIKDASAAPALIEARMRDEDGTVGLKADEAIQGMGRRAVPALIEALGDDDKEVREYADGMLGECARVSRKDLKLLASAARKARRAGRPTAEFVGLYHKWFEILSERAREKSEVKKMRAPSRPRTPGDKQRRSTVRGAGI